MPCKYKFTLINLKPVTLWAQSKRFRFLGCLYFILRKSFSKTELIFKDYSVTLIVLFSGYKSLHIRTIHCRYQNFTKPRAIQCLFSDQSIFAGSICLTKFWQSQCLVRLTHYWILQAHGRKSKGNILFWG